MDKRIIFMLAALVAAIACARCAMGSEIERQAYERMRGDWRCGGPHLAKIPANVEMKWSKGNDAICRQVCATSGGSFTKYANGNWALFGERGMECCCANQVPVVYNNRKYEKGGPYIDNEAQRILGVYSMSPLED